MRRTLVQHLLQLTVAIAVLAGTQHPGAHGQEPAENVDPARHGNIARAQELSRRAFDAMTAAQEANEFDLGGHAARAKELLRQANEEMKQAALTANRRDR